MTPGEMLRYSRQVLFPPIGDSGQNRIRAASVVIVGCGALGSFQAESLTRAGIGKLRIIDRDYVDFSNLQRQMLYVEADAESETPKAIAAAARLAQVNSQVQVDPRVTDLTPSNAEDLLSDCDLILDGTDNFETRYLINDISVKHGIPWVYGAAVASRGLVMPVIPGLGPCFACVYPDPPSGLQPTCDVDGVLGAITAAIAARQVALCLRWLVGWPDFRCVIETYDVWTGHSRYITPAPDPACAVCGLRQFAYLDGFRRKPVSLCGRNAVQLHENARPLDLRQLAERLRPLGGVRVNDFALRLTLSPFELTVFPDGRAIVKGTTDIGVARSVYARYIGA
jgi:molybdopterin/thiamine biosynthesis adenylyltransferase